VELANLNDAERVSAIHREYIAAGANAIKTNTFRANPEIFPDINQLTRIIKSGYAIAVNAAVSASSFSPSPVEVFADIGCVDEDPGHYLTVAGIFIEAGARNFLFETLSGFDGIAEAASEIKRRVPGAQVIASFAVSQEGYSAKSLHYRQLLKQAAECADIDVAGLNCICGPAHLFNLTRELGGAGKPLSVMPNAGYPVRVDGRIVFNDNADYFGEKLLDIRRLGVEVLGGCCGTTPAHIRRAIEIITEAERGHAKKQPKTARPSLPAETGGFTGALKLKPIMVELDPPLDSDNSFLLSAAAELMALNVGTITLADSPLSRPRADSVLTASKLKTEIGVDVLPHITCRDRNSIALRGALLGARAFGIDKVLIVTGDQLANAGVYKNDAVFSFNSIQLISYVNNLNHELFAGSPFSIGAALNVNALSFNAELKRAKQKIENGASFLLTQPIFSEEAVNNFIRAKNELDCKLYAGILPVVSYKNAVFLNNEVSGIKIPQGTVDALKDKSRRRDVSLRLGADTVKAVYAYADGFYIMTPLKKVGLVADLIRTCFYE
jgi:homocysteine S-methyltransferase